MNTSPADIVQFINGLNNSSAHLNSAVRALADAGHQDTTLFNRLKDLHEQQEQLINQLQPAILFKDDTTID